MSYTLTETTLHGLPVLRIQTDLCTAIVSRYGGQLLSFIPSGGSDILWLSPLAKGAPGAIRGGVPVCWPYFSKENQPQDAPQHGFARNRTWEIEGPHQDSEGHLHLALELPAESSTPLRLRQSLVLGSGLQQTLTTHNPSATEVAFTQALHSYFQVGDAQQVRLEGLAGLEYADRYAGTDFTQIGDWTLQDPRDPGRSDRTYHAAEGRYLLHDPVLKRRLCISSHGSHAVVVWNPGQSGAQAMGDVPDASWNQFICVEVANAARDIITLAAGATHTLSQTVEVLPAA